MSYKDLDPIIESWCSDHGLRLVRSDKDWEVRSVNLMDSRGTKRITQIWIDEPKDPTANVTIHIWKMNPDKKKEIRVPVSNLRQGLEKALLWGQSGD